MTRSYIAGICFRSWMSISEKVVGFVYQYFEKKKKTLK